MPTSCGTPVIDGRPIGGADQLVRLDRCDVLQALAGRGLLPVMCVRRSHAPRGVAMVR